MAEVQPLTIDNDGLALAITVQGQGPDLLFVHGLGSAQVLWRPFISELAANYRCWNLDLRGHGASARAAEYTIDGYGSDVAAALDHIGRPTIGIGHSLGGSSLAQVASEDHAQLVGLYVLDAPLLRGADERSSSAAIFERQLAMLREFQPASRPIGDYEAVLAQAPNPVGGTNRDTMLREQLWGRAESLSQLDPECIASALRVPIQSRPPVIEVPLRVVAADPTMGAAFAPAHAMQLADLTPHAEVETIHGVGHQLMMMKHFDKQIFDDLDQWLSRTVE